MRQRSLQFTLEITDMLRVSPGSLHMLVFKTTDLPPEFVPGA